MLSDISSITAYLLYLGGKVNSLKSCFGARSFMFGGQSVAFWGLSFLQPPCPRRCMAPNSLPCADGAVKNLLTHSLAAAFIVDNEQLSIA